MKHFPKDLREKAAEVAMSFVGADVEDWHIEAIADALLLERGRCAMIADQFRTTALSDYDHGCHYAADHIGSMIRRGDG